MVSYVALLRGINIAGHKMVSMGELRDMVRALGFHDPRTLLQSGNLVFAGDGRRSAASLERLLEQETQKRLGVQTDYMVRTAVELQSAIDANPFQAEAQHDPGHLVIVFLKAAPPETSVAALRAAIPGRERVHLAGRELYVVYPDGIGRSKLTPALMEKHLGGHRGTARNWNTALKLRAAVERDVVT